MLTEEEAFYRDLALPSWKELLDDAERRLSRQKDRKKDGRRRQFNVNIADRAQLDALSDALEMPRSKVINLALAELAARLQIHDDQYIRCFIRSCKRIARWLEDEKDCDHELAVRAAGKIGRDKLVSRKEWMDLLERKQPPFLPGGVITAKELVQGKEPSKGYTFKSKQHRIAWRFKKKVEVIMRDRYKNQMWRYIGENR